MLGVYRTNFETEILWVFLLLENKNNTYYYYCLASTDASQPQSIKWYEETFKTCLWEDFNIVGDKE